MRNNEALNCLFSEVVCLDTRFVLSTDTFSGFISRSHININCNPSFSLSYYFQCNFPDSNLCNAASALNKVSLNILAIFFSSLLDVPLYSLLY